MADWLPKGDIPLQAAAARVIGALAATPIPYGLVAADATALQAKLDDFSAKIPAAETAKAAATTAVSNKDASRAVLEKALRDTVAQIQVNPAVTDALRVDAGIPVRDVVRSYIAPIPPRDLVANTGRDRTHDLKWNANGNTSGILYVVEQKRGADTEFSLVSVVTATKVTLPEATAGQRVDYQVRARRGSETSAPSNVATVNAG